ncbi:MAG: cell division protein FtsL [Pseudomonadota bacterium]
MRSVLFLSTASLVLLLAGWAYNENYKTKAEIAAVETLQRDIAAKGKRLAVLKAEWAYLNRPDRLRKLAEMKFDELGLLPFEPGQFATTREISKPLPVFDIFKDGVEAMARLEEAQ